MIFRRITLDLFLAAEELARELQNRVPRFLTAHTWVAFYPWWANDSGPRGMICTRCDVTWWTSSYHPEPREACVVHEWTAPS